MRKKQLCGTVWECNEFMHRDPHIVIAGAGAIGCFFVMFIINSTVGLISIGLVIAMYIYLTKKKNLESEEGDTRSGMFNSLAEWSAKMVGDLPEASERSWQPNLLVPAQQINDIVRSYKIMYNLARPKGSIKILGFNNGKDFAKLKKRLPELCENFSSQGISTAHALIQTESFGSGVLTAMQCLKASFFSPNSLFLSLTDDHSHDAAVKRLLEHASEFGFGAYLFVPFQKLGLGLERTINLWIDPEDVGADLGYKIKLVNVAILTSYLLKENWNGELNLIVQSNPSSEEIDPTEKLKTFIEKLTILARLPKDTKVHFVDTQATQWEDSIPNADLNVLAVKPKEIDMAAIRKQLEVFETSLLFTLDGGKENAFA
ncbi:MAG: hypothetical protein AAF598_14140 [Bacteroidota bacterium]